MARVTHESKIRYVQIADVTAEPGSGVYLVLAGRWWCHRPGKGLLMYARSPQCNSDRRLAERVRDSCWPDAELVFVTRAYLPHDCGDYV